MNVEDFDSSAEIYEAVGEILHEIAADRTESDIRDLCEKFHTILKPESDKINSKNRKILDAPILLGQMSANLDTDVENMTSIWVQQRNDSLVNIDEISSQKTCQINCEKSFRKSMRKSWRKLKQRSSRNRANVTASSSTLPRWFLSYKQLQLHKFSARKTQKSTPKDNRDPWTFELKTSTFPSAIAFF